MSSPACSRAAAGRTRTGSSMAAFSGLGLDRANWAAGVQVVFPNVFDFTSLRARKAAAAASARAETALYDEALLTVTSQQQAAAAMVAGRAGRRRQYAGAARRGAAERITGTRPLSGRARQHRRSGRRPEPARASGGPGSARAHRRLARAAGAGGGARDARAVCLAGDPVRRSSLTDVADPRRPPASRSRSWSR